MALIKGRVKQDTLTPYLQKLQENMSASKDGITQNASKSIAEMIYELAPVWEGSSNPGSNHALSESALLYKNWHFKSSNAQTVLDIIVSGKDNVVSFSEFREDGNRYRPPEMDYAFYQETGIHSEAMQTPRERFFVKRATVMEASNFFNSVEKQLQIILEGGTISKTNSGKLF